MRFRIKSVTYDSRLQDVDFGHGDVPAFLLAEEIGSWLEHEAAGCQFQDLRHPGFWDSFRDSLIKYSLSTAN
jgi:hypothetical protein